MIGLIPISVWLIGITLEFILPVPIIETWGGLISGFPDEAPVWPKFVKVIVASLVSPGSNEFVFALQKIGKKVGLLDAAIYGPSLPRTIGLNEKPKTDGKFLFPIEKYGAQFMSLGFLVDDS